MKYECRKCGKVCSNIISATFHSQMEHGKSIPKADFEKVLNYHTKRIKAVLKTIFNLMMFVSIVIIKCLSLPGHLVYRRLQ